MSQHEEDGSIVCGFCGVSFDVHEVLSPNCEVNSPQQEHPYKLPGGAQRTERAPRYDLIPPAGLRRVAARFALGAEKHGEGNWLKSLNTREDARAFCYEAYNHLQEHLQKMLEHRHPNDDDLAAAGWAVLTLIHVEEKFKCRWIDL